LGNIYAEKVCNDAHRFWIHDDGVAPANSESNTALIA